MKKIKRLLSKNSKLLIFLLLVFSFIVTPLVLAAESDNWAVGQTVGGFWKTVMSNQVANEGWWTKQIMNSTNFSMGLLNGCDPADDPDCPAEMESGLNGYLASVAINTTNGMPASSVEYLADLGRSLGIIPKPAYAQGIGWQGFLPILPVWKAFRNIAYLALVIVFVIIGFMIMFRKKLNPQTVITVQEAIPRIIVTMLLITFSYAIAGLVLDLTQLATRIIGNTFQETGLVAIPRAGENPEDKLNAIYDANILKLLRPLSNSTELAKAIGRFPSFSLSKAFAWLLGNVLNLILAVTLFFLMFRTLFALLGPYVQIVLSIIFAPFQLLMGAIPGNNDALGKWIKGLLSNAAVFPVVLAMLFLVAIFKSSPEVALGSPCKTWTCKTFKVDWSTKSDRFAIAYPAAGIGNWGSAVGELIGLGILLMVPKVAELTKAFIMGKEFPGGEAALAELKKQLGKIPVIGSQVVS